VDIPSHTRRGIFSRQGGWFLGSSALWLLVGNLFYVGSQWFVVLMLARLSGAEAVGMFALASAIVVPVITLLQLSLRIALVTDVAEQNPFSDYLFLRVATSLLAFVVITVAATVLGYRGAFWMVIAFLGIARALDSVNDIYYGLLQKAHRHKRWAQLMMIQGGLAVVLCTGAIALTGSVVGMSAAFGCSFALTLLLLIARTRENRSAQERGAIVQLKRMGNLAVRSFPLAIAQAIVALSVATPRYIIGHFGSTGDVGQYSVAEQLVAILGLLSFAIGNAALPQMARLWGHGDGKGFHNFLIKLLGVHLAVGVVGVMGTVILGDLIISFAYGPGFPAAAVLLPWLTAAYSVLLLANACGVAVTAQGRYAAPIPVLAIALVVNTSVSYLAVARFGITGIAIGAAIGGAIQVACYGFFLRDTLFLSRRT
jgi:O-antigen/teichoic acid export membrane protein